MSAMRVTNREVLSYLPFAPWVRTPHIRIWGLVAGIEVLKIQKIVNSARNVEINWNRVNTVMTFFLRKI